MKNKLNAIFALLFSKESKASVQTKAPVLVISDLAKYQVEAERAICAIDTMASFYTKRGGDVDERFTADCIVLMQTLKGTIERLYDVDRPSKDAAKSDAWV